MVFEWKHFPVHTALQLLQEIQKMMGEMNCPPEQFADRITFMSMYNDMVWGNEKNKSLCIENSALVSECATKIPKGHWSFLGPGCEVRFTEERCKAKEVDNCQYTIVVTQTPRS